MTDYPSQEQGARDQPLRAVSGLLLLFGHNSRPSREDVRNAIAKLDGVSISHEPGAALNGSAGQDHEGTGQQAWLELLIDGLTFDLLGLSPGPALDLPPPTHRFAVDGWSGDDMVGAIGLAPGPHLSGAGHTLPVVKGWVGLGANLCSAFDAATSVYWHPSRSLIGKEYFEKIIGDWLDGGAFPALGLTGFSRSSDGRLLSEGLSFFIGQELRLERDLADDMTAATRLAIRLVHQLVSHGTLDEAQHVTAPDGSSLALRPVEQGRIISVSAR